MGLCQLVYASRPREGLGERELADILRSARTFNAARGITGFLAYWPPGDDGSPPWFLQVLEGPRREVSDLYLRIARDPRHDQVATLGLQRVHARNFGPWAMGAISVATAWNRALIGSFLGPDPLDPDRLDPEEAVGLLLALAASEHAHVVRGRPSLPAALP